VIASFFVTSWITCFIAMVHALCAFSEDPVLLVFKPKYPKFGTPQRALPLSWISRKISRLKALNRRQWPRLKAFTTASLVFLGDIQILTGTAILIAGIAQIKTMSGYHQALVFNFWFLALNSYFSIGHLPIYELKDGHRSWRYWTRRALEFITLTLAVVFFFLFNSQSEVSCYITRGEASGLFSVILAWAWLLVTLEAISYLGAALLFKLVAVNFPYNKWIKRHPYPWITTSEEAKERWLFLVTRLLYLPPSCGDPLCTFGSSYSWGDAHIHTPHRFI